MLWYLYSFLSSVSNIDINFQKKNHVKIICQNFACVSFFNYRVIFYTKANKQIYFRSILEKQVHKLSHIIYESPFHEKNNPSSLIQEHCHQKLLPNWFSLSVSVVVGVAPLSSPRIFINLVLFVLLILENYLKSQYNFRLLWIILFPSSVQKEIPPNHWLKLMIVEHKSYSLDIFPATMWLRVCTWISRKKIVGLYCIKIVRFFLFFSWSLPIKNNCDLAYCVTAAATL